MFPSSMIWADGGAVEISTFGLWFVFFTFCLSRLEMRWILWHEFMKEHAHLDAWLRLAEQAVASLNSTYITFIAAKEELRKFEVRSKNCVYLNNQNLK